MEYILAVTMKIQNLQFLLEKLLFWLLVFRPHLLHLDELSPSGICWSVLWFNFFCLYHVGGLRAILTDQNKLVVAVGGVTALAAGIYTTRYCWKL